MSGHTLSAASATRHTENEAHREQAGGTGIDQEQPGGIAGRVLVHCTEFGMRAVSSEDHRPHPEQEGERGRVPAAEHRHLPHDEKREGQRDDQPRSRPRE